METGMTIFFKEALPDPPRRFGLTTEPESLTRAFPQHSKTIASAKIWVRFSLTLTATATSIFTW
jgi:hypothetical protein